MMNVSTLTVTLLVCVILECAHSASFERGWERFSPRSKRSAVNRVSVVESWTSVCEEVCRVGYGGLGCALVECTTQNGLGYSGKFQAICPSLCENNLGSAKCDCTLSRPNPDVKSARNSLCSETCGWRTSLSGCSKCKKAVTSTTVDDITDDYGSTNTTDDEIPTTDEYSTDEEDTTTDEEDSTTESNEVDTTTEEATTTTSTTTTTQATTTTTRTTTQATTTTTPNWESLCETLCRNGEGGSLCNCDIPPFF